MIDPAELRSLWDFSDPAGSEQRFRQRRSSCTDASDVAVLTTQVARALGLQGQYVEAHVQLDHLTTVEGEVGVRIALERGRLHRSAGEPDRAAVCFERARDLADRAGLPGLSVDALHMLAILPEDAAEQVRRHREALAVARASTDEEARRWVAPLLNNLGMALHGVDDLDAALAVFSEAVQVRRAAGEESEAAVARWMVAWTLRLLGRGGEALSIQQELAAENAAANRPDPYVHDELATLHAERGESDRSAHHRSEAARLRRLA